jgi:hypothetical protein
MCEKFGSLDEPWPGTGEIGVRIDRIEAVFPGCRKIAPSARPRGTKSPFIENEGALPIERDIWYGTR